MGERPEKKEAIGVILEESFDEKAPSLGIPPFVLLSLCRNFSVCVLLYMNLRAGCVRHSGIALGVCVFVCDRSLARRGLGGFLELNLTRSHRFFAWL